MKNKIQILHVDDNSLDRQLVKDALCKEHDTFEVIEADSREKFEQYLAEKDFDIVLSDFNILGFDGLKVLQIVHEKNPEIPVIIVTGTGSEEVAIQAMKMGASDYVIKSARHIRGLAPTIEQVLEKKRLQHEKSEVLDELKISEKKYKLLFDSNPHPMWVYELDTLNFLEVNHSAISKYGYNREEFLTMNLKDIRPLEDIEKLYEDIRQRADEYSFSGEWRHKNKEGDVFFVEILSHSINFNHKKARLVLVNDITERKKTEDKLKLYIRAIEQSSVSLNITDKKGDIIYVNSGFTALSGYSSKEAISRNPRFLKSGVHTNDFYKKLWDTLLTGNNWSGDLCNKNKDGNLYWVQTTISPVVDSIGNITHFVAIKENITEKKKMIDELFIAKEKAEESDRLKSAFLANMSHEIRTPINIITGYAEFLKDENITKNELSHYITLIQNNSIRLLNLINNILVLSKIESGQMLIEKNFFNINNLIDELFEQNKKIATEKKIEFIIHKELSENQALIYNSENLIYHIFTNLIDNALKYTKIGAIEFGYNFLNDNIELFIRDTGIGITENYISKIFNRFNQEDARLNRTYEGAGLGLSIVKGIVELLNGTISVNSKKGIGTAFSITIPLEKIAPIHVEFETKSDFEIKNDKKINLLIVEDDEVSFFLLKKQLLREFSCTIIHAINGDIAIEKVKKHPEITCVLMDLHLPGVDGFEATKIIKEIKSELPVFAVTAAVLDADKDKALKAGCDEFISKPIDKEQLFRLIEKYGKNKTTIEKLNDKNITLLIVEDDEASFYLLNMQISEEINCTIIHSISGLNAIEKVNEHPEISCVLMDLHMPGIDGFETTERIKKIKKDLPIFAVTAATFESSKEKAFKAGCDEFFTKPVNRDILYECILKYIVKRK